MKRILFAFAVIATVAMTSCQREKDFNSSELGKNGIAFVLQGAPLTRSADVSAIERTAIPVDVQDCEEQFFLEETVEDLNAAYAPATKGTPAYTENVGKLYSNQLFVHAAGNFGDATFENVDKEMVAGGWRFHHNYDGDPWPNETDAVDFYLRMPVDMNGVTDLAYGKTDNKPTVSFKLTSPGTAAEQQDIIFSALTASKEDYLNSLPNGMPVLFHHALTGVKFRIVNNDEHVLGEDGKPLGKEKRTQTYITKVSITGLRRSGTCIVTPKAETENNTDDRTIYSSGDHTFTTTGTAGTIAWTYLEDKGEFIQSFEEANLVDYEGGSFGSKGDYPESFSGAGNKNNLNDADASMTFWFIPQEMTDDVVMTVEFHVWDGDKDQPTKTLTVNLGKIAKENDLTKAWKAGELRTFSLKPLNVNVEIQDTMNQYVKSDVKIKNTGNVTQYVRVYMIGNWVGKRQIKAGEYNTDDTILMGYTTQTGTDEVLRWNDKDFTGSAAAPDYEPWTSPGGNVYDYTPYGTFVGLPPMGTKTAGGTKVNDWIRHDKFYYYTQPIGPGKNVPDSKPLFTSYTVDEDKIPDFWITDNTGLTRLLAKDVHLVMDLAVQAIETPMNADGTPAKTYDQAWADALGVTVEGLNDL